MPYEILQVLAERHTKTYRGKRFGRWIVALNIDFNTVSHVRLLGTTQGSRHISFVMPGIAESRGEL
jgi:hypothetical protein